MHQEDSTFGAEPQRLDRLIALGLTESAEEAPVSQGRPLEVAAGSVGRYKLLQALGEGGMGVVYLAEQTEPIRRQVALKIIKLGMDTRQVIARFEAERQALALMDHPNIAKVLDAGATEAGRPYFVMELVTGVSITKYCDKNSLSTNDRLTLFLQVCNAVQHAHQKGIIHRDLKPSNVLVTLVDGSPVPKIIDFGIAKATEQRLTEKTLFTRYGHIVGTPVYMSPEQAELSELDIDTRSDVYSLGVLLYELLTGVTPFSKEELRQVGYLEMQRVIREQVPVKPSTKLSTLGDTLTDVAQRRSSTPELLRKAVRGDLDWIVMKSLEKDRVRRYETVSGLAEDIRRHLEHEPVLACRPTPAYRFGKFLRRHRPQILAALALVVVAAAAAAVVSLWNRDRLRLLEAAGFRDQSLLSQARGQYAAGDRQAALKTIQSILQSRHVGPEAQLLYANLLVEGRLPDEATALLKQLLKDRREIAGAAHALWVRLLWESESLDTDTLKEIEEHQRLADALLPDTAEAYFLRGVSAITIEEQLAALNRALELDPSHYESYRLRVFTYNASRKYDKMKDDALAMIVLRPRDPLGYSLRGLAWHQLGHFSEAAAEYGRALALMLPQSAQYAELSGRRCESLMRMGQYEGVLTEAQEVLKNAPKAAVLNSQVFCALTALGRYEEADALMQRLAQFPDDTDDQVRLRSMKYVFDTLMAGGRWHPPDREPEGPAFFYVLEAEEMYRELSAKARPLIPDSFSASWSPDGTKVAFAQGLPGYSGVAVYDLATKETDLLTVPGKDPSWSPDGHHIAFVRDAQALRLSEQTTNQMKRNSDTYVMGEEVWIMNADGSEPRRLVRQACSPGWSADGQRVFYYCRKSSVLSSMSIEDPQAQPIAICFCPYGAPTMSPHGNYVAKLCGDNERSAVLQIQDVDTQSCIAEWPTPLATSAPLWSPNGHEVSMGGRTGIRSRTGLWIYDLRKKEGVKVLSGKIGGASWSSDRRQLLIRISEPYWGTWVADLDPNLSTAKVLGPAQTLEEHCREAVVICAEELRVVPDSFVDRWVRAISALWIEHPRAQAYLQELDLVLDRCPGAPSAHPYIYAAHAEHLLAYSGLCQQLEPLAFIMARKAVVQQAGYAMQLAPLFDRLGQNEHATQLRQLAQADTLRGSCRYEGGSDTYLMVGCGGNIGGTIDDFHFTSKKLSGDGSITARIVSLEDVPGPALAGVMIRESLDPRAKFAAVYVTPSSGVTFQAREMDNALVLRDAYMATREQNLLRAQVWVRIDRKGEQFSAFYSADGVTWTSMVWGPQSIFMPGTVYIGLAVTSHDNRKTVEACISHVTTNGNVSPSGPFTESQDIRLLVPP